MPNAISLYQSEVMHQRYFPQRYRFDYKVFNFLIDIDDQNDKSSAILSFDRFNIFSVYTKDHGPRDGNNWRDWIDNILDQEQLSNAKHKIKLLCFPRILGYAFNPLSLWYCYGKDEKLYAIVCEVSNTFGEHHHYVLHKNNSPYDNKVQAQKEKKFHVSPFINMNAEYHFMMDSPNDDLTIIINEHQNSELMLTATQRGKRIKIGTPHLFALF